MHVACAERVEIIRRVILVIIAKKPIDSAHQLLLHFMTLLKWYPISYFPVFDGLFLMLYHLSSIWEFKVLMLMGLSLTVSRLNVVM